MDNNIDKGIGNINKIYDNLNYFDQYGASVITFFIISIVVILLCAFCYAKINIQPIIDDWPNQRCKPYYLPFAGFITKPPNVSAFDYTAQNFNYCTQNILTSITGTMLQPLTYVTNIFNMIVSQMNNDIDSGRAMFNKVRTFFESITQEIMGRILNMMVPLQQIIISFKDLIGKIQGTMTAGLFTLLGSFYTLQALMGAIAEFIIIILIAMAVMIVIFWLVPFTWGAAISMTAVFVAISIPLAIMLAFMMDVLHVQPDLSIPTLKCFDKETDILLKDGSSKKIININVGDELYHDGKVTSKIKVETKGSEMYSLNNIIVSDTHLIHYRGEWIRVNNHHDAKKIIDYNEPYLYCLNTESKQLFINNILFSDWDELVRDKLSSVMKNSKYNILENSSDIHKYFDSGFFGSTKIKLKNNINTPIKDIKVGDILENGEKVYGIVEICGKSLKNQFEYILGKNIFIKGGPNINIIENNIQKTTLMMDSKKCKKVDKKDDILYHLITDTGFFYIENFKFCDYNAIFEVL